MVREENEKMKDNESVIPIDLATDKDYVKDRRMELERDIVFFTLFFILILKNSLIKEKI